MLANRRKKEAERLLEQETQKSKEKQKKDKEIEKDKEEEEETSDEEVEVKSLIRKDEICTPTKSSGARFFYTSEEQDLSCKLHKRR